MPDLRKLDWKKFVGRRLGSASMPPAAKEEVIAELALHLEEAYEHARLSGTTHRVALRLALQEAKDWRSLADHLRDAKQKKTMNHRTKTLWLPGMAILFTVGLVLLFLDRAAVLQRLIWIGCMAMLFGTAISEANRLNRRTRSIWLPAIVNLTLTTGLLFMLDRLNLEEPGLATGGNIAKAFRIFWLLPLPVLGAVGARLAKRAHASRAERLIAGVAPSLVWLAVLAVLGLVFTLDHRDFEGVSLHDLTLSAVGLVILPALALMLGAMPFLRDQEHVAVEQD
jgi:hypothetical protein